MEFHDPNMVQTIPTHRDGLQFTFQTLSHIAAPIELDIGSGMSLVISTENAGSISEIAIPSGGISLVSMQKSQTKLLSSPYSTCTDEVLGRNYFEECYARCKTTLIQLHGVMESFKKNKLKIGMKQIQPKFKSTRLTRVKRLQSYARSLF